MNGKVALGVGSKSGDAQRHRARRIVEKRDGKAAVRGKDVGHKRAIKSGGSNASSNLRVETVSGNRSAGGKVEIELGRQLVLLSEKEL